MHLRLPYILALAADRRGGRGRDDDSDEFEVHAPEGPIVPWPDRRRNHGGRREDELDDAALRGWSFWAKVMFVHRAKLIAFCAFASGALGYLGATLGIQTRVRKLEEITTQTATRVSNLEDAEPLKLYILCVLLREEHPTLVPRECNEVMPPAGGNMVPVPQSRRKP